MLRGAPGARALRPPRVGAWLSVVLVLVVAGWSPGPADADSWGPYEPQRIVDSTGRFVVTIEPTETGNHLTPGRTGPRGRYRFLEIIDGAEMIRGAGTLDELPLDVRIAPRGRGFAALRAAFGDGRGRCIVLADERGVVRRALALTEIWTPSDLDGMERTSSSLIWMRGAWWTSDGSALVLLPFPGGGDAAPTVIPLDPRAKPRPVGDAEVLDALDGAEGAGPDLALDLVAERRIVAAGARVKAIAADPATTPSRRVRAWVAVAALGGADGVAKVLEVVRLSPPDDAARALRELALSRLELAVGRDSLGVLAALHAGAGSDADLDREVLYRITWLRSADPKDVVRRMADVQGRDASLTRALAGMAAYLRDPDASRAVLVAAASTSGEAVEAAMSWFWRARRPDASAILAGALRERPRETAALVEWFEDHAYPSVVAALIDELERRLRTRDEKVLASLAQALERQTGEKHGTDVAAWRRWSAGRSK